MKSGSQPKVCGVLAPHRYTCPVKAPASIPMSHSKGEPQFIRGLACSSVATCWNVLFYVLDLFAMSTKCARMILWFVLYLSSPPSCQIRHNVIVVSVVTDACCSWLLYCYPGLCYGIYDTLQCICDCNFHY